MFLSPFPVKLLPLALPGNGCVGADTGLGLGRKGGSRRTCLAHGRVLKGGCGCVGFGWRGLWSVPVVPHYFGVMDAFECLKNALSLSPGKKNAPFNFGDNFQEAPGPPDGADQQDPLAVDS